VGEDEVVKDLTNVSACSGVRVFTHVLVINGRSFVPFPISLYISGSALCLVLRYQPEKGFGWMDRVQKS
jgi:hypothetical protein